MKTESGFYDVYPVAFSLFGADGALDRVAVRRQVQAMVLQGVQGVTVLGLVSDPRQRRGRRIDQRRHPSSGHRRPSEH